MTPSKGITSTISSKLERKLKKDGYTYIAGIDEVGMGPLAGPVVAAAVVFNGHRRIANVDDSKRVSASMREELYDKIQNKAVSVGVGIVGVDFIASKNIYWASREAMLEAIAQLEPLPDYLLIDGNKPLDIPIPQESIVGGDGKCFCIAAASIIAKVTRDRIMLELHEAHPEYGWDTNKGYPTPYHRAAIKKYGPTPLHRKNFAGVYKDGKWGPLDVDKILGIDDSVYENYSCQ